MESSNITMNATTIKKAGEIWSYLSSESSKKKSDAIVICCSYDLRVCDHACELITEGYSDTLVISGKSGNWTRHLWIEPEAHIFYQRAKSNGINSQKILLESNATNFGENITFSKALIPLSTSITFVTKPNSILRAKLTAEAQWPEINFSVSCPELKFPNEISNIIGVWGVISEMVGDIDRIIKYPEHGFQTKHQLPENIIANWRYLKDQGFTSHLLPAVTRRADTKKEA